MAAAGAEARENFLGLMAHRLRCCEQHSRIEIALQRDLRAHTCAGIADVDGPVEPDCIGTGLCQALEPETSAFGEDDARYELAVIRAMKLRANAIQIEGGKLFERARR